MACSKPVLQGQSLALCQLCEVDTNIKWKCIDCDLLLCTKCKDKIHSKVKTAEEHRIISIKDIGKQSDEQSIQSVITSGVGTSLEQDTRHPVNNGQFSLELFILQEYKTKIGIHYIKPLGDDTLWIGSSNDKKFFSFKSSKHLQKVKLESDHLKIISSFNVDVGDIAFTPFHDLILADRTPKLKQIFYNSNKVTESKYCVEPYNVRCVHVTRDNKVVVGTSEGAVYVMDINGVHQEIYRCYHNAKPLFTRPYRITSTSTGTLCVIDIISFDEPQGRLVLLGQGEVINVYIGHRSINSDENPLFPTGVVTTSNDNIIVADCRNHVLHILNNTGKFLTYYNTLEIGIKFPYSLAAGQFSILYIGCWLSEDIGKLYKLNFSVICDSSL